MADTQRMGFEGRVLYGTAGATGTTDLTNAKDITYGFAKESGDTTVRGAGTSPPIRTEKVTQRVVDIEFVMLNDSADTSLEAIRVAAYAGTPIAIRTKDYSSGKGFDGDCTAAVSHPYPLNGEQVVTITCNPTRDEGRDPSLYV